MTSERSWSNFSIVLLSFYFFVQYVGGSWFRIWALLVPALFCCCYSLLHYYSITTICLYYSTCKTLGLRILWSWEYSVHRAQLTEITQWFLKRMLSQFRVVGGFGVQGGNRPPPLARFRQKKNLLLKRSWISTCPPRCSDVPTALHNITAVYCSVSNFQTV